MSDPPPTTRCSGTLGLQAVRILTVLSSYYCHDHNKRPVHETSRSRFNPAASPSYPRRTSVRRFRIGVRFKPRPSAARPPSSSKSLHTFWPVDTVVSTVKMSTGDHDLVFALNRNSGTLTERRSVLLPRRELIPPVRLPPSRCARVLSFRGGGVPCGTPANRSVLYHTRCRRRRYVQAYFGRYQLFEHAVSF